MWYNVHGIDNLLTILDLIHWLRYILDVSCWMFEKKSLAEISTCKQSPFIHTGALWGGDLGVHADLLARSWNQGDGGPKNGEIWVAVPKGWVGSRNGSHFLLDIFLLFFLDVLQDEENGDIDWEPLERILGGFGPDCLSCFWNNDKRGCIIWSIEKNPANSQILTSSFLAPF